MEKLVVGRWLSLGVWMVAAAGATGCTVDSKEIGATAGEESTGGESVGEGETTGGGATDSLSGTGMAESGGQVTATGGVDTGEFETGQVDTGELDTGGTTGTDTGGGESGLTDPLPCGEAFTEAACRMAGGAGGEECAWFEVSTWVFELDSACFDLDMDQGYCFTTQQGDDGCGTEFIDPTCPDGETIVYFNSVGLEIGAQEIFTEPMMGSTCDGPGGDFEPCQFDGVTYTPPECECGCPG